jgi:YHS domain-containing protein
MRAWNQRALLGVGVTVLGAMSFATPPERTLSVDAVELIAGRETAGKAEFVVVHEGIEYRFATPENKAAFEKEPAKFEAADGGACGRMGPLASLGDARRFAVHGGRVYFFSSDGCRAGFLKEPDSYIEVDDTMPFGGNDQVLKGRATLDKMVAWAGGAERLKAIPSYRSHAARTEKQGGKDWAVTNETVIVFPDSYFQKEAWNESWFSTVSSAEGGAMGSSRGLERIASSRTRAFKRAMAHQPIVLLKAHVDGSPKADCPGLVVIGDGEGEVDGLAVEFVKVWLNGSGSRLAVEKSSGKLLELSFHGRDGTMKVGDSARKFTTYATVDGITLPTVYTVRFNGKELASAAGKMDNFEVGETVPPDTFRIGPK